MHVGGVFVCLFVLWLFLCFFIDSCVPNTFRVACRGPLGILVYVGTSEKACSQIQTQSCTGRMEGRRSHGNVTKLFKEVTVMGTRGRRVAWGAVCERVHGRAPGAYENAKVSCS